MKINQIYLLWVIVIIQSIFIISTLAHFTMLSDKVSEKPAIMVVDIFGSVADFQYCASGTCMDEDSISSAELIYYLQKYEKEDYVKAFILDIDSNGGAGFDLEKHIHSMKKPIVAVVRDQALSGGYSIAAATQRIFTNEISNIADIGFLRIVNYTHNGTLRNCYISHSTIKLMYRPDCPGFNPTEYVEHQRMLAKASQQMATDIAHFRNLPSKYMIQFADGNIFKGNEALTLKLVDEIGGLPEAKIWLENQTGMKLNLLYLREVEKA